MLSRRTFLKALALLGVAAYFSPTALLSNRSTVTPKRSSDRRPKVTRIHNSKATSWNYKTGSYIDHINYDEVRKMFDAGLMEHTGTSSIEDAWKEIVPGYKEGKKIVIKPNLNNTGIGYSQAIMTSPQVIAATVDSLVEAGYSPRDITIYDLTAKINKALVPWLDRHQTHKVFWRKYKSYLEILYARLHFGQQDQDSNAPIKMRSLIIDDLGDDVTCYIPNVLSNADYLINLPVLKAHQFVLQSNVLKNHFGTVRFSNYNTYPVVLHGQNIEHNIVDINSNEHIQHKTSIIIVDALYGAPLFTRDQYGRVPTPWETLSTGSTPSSLFFSSDPVAVESVLADYIIKEQEYGGYTPYSHDYLHDAMESGLGTHEHRNSSGRYKSIDYTEIQI